jgi:hypothetical protein
MFKRHLIVSCFVLFAGLAHAQTPEKDSIPASSTDLAGDTDLDYDELFNELDLFLDSILAPRSYFLATLGAGQGYFNFTNNSGGINTVRKYTFTPTLGYYGKSGWGFTAAGNMISNEGKMDLYQVSLSPSFDYLKDRDYALGFAYMRYLTKDSASFYVSPLENEINGYFVWRKSWLQTGIAASYGWGNRTEYKKRLKFLQRLRRRVLLITTTEESIADFSLTGSVKHDFYWLNVFSKRDYIKITPQLSSSAGTQKFGFNQTTGTYGLSRYNILYSSPSSNLDDKVKFQPLSVTLYLRTEYSIGKFFIQPQVLFDYYFPATDNNFTTLFSVNAGFVF